MPLLDRALEHFAPQIALRRAQARAALSTLRSTSMRYDAARGNSRTASLRAIPSDADAAAYVQRARLAQIAQDMIRNTPLATRAQAVIAANVVGDGIIPKIKGGSKSAREALLRKIEQHCDTTAIDADGIHTLYGLQDLAARTMVADGEVLIRRRARSGADGLPLPFQLQVLEAAYLDSTRDAELSNGGYIREGIQYSPIGRREGYWLLRDHPGAAYPTRLEESRLVPASEIIHLFRQDRPGQMRGVTWFAPVALKIADLGDFQDAQVMRQKIAACFAAFRVNMNGEALEDEDDPQGLESLSPGRIQTLAPGEDIRFSAPPQVADFDPFTKGILREVAAGLGITYEALTGDFSGVTFSSARMGRLEMNRLVSSWQWKTMIPLMLQPIGRWIVEDFSLQRMTRPGDLAIEWVPPAKPIVDPTREIPAMRDAVQAGFTSRSQVVRELGYDPERLIAEQEDDHREAERRGLLFSSDARAPRAALVPPDTDPADITVDPTLE